MYKPTLEEMKDLVNNNNSVWTMSNAVIDPDIHCQYTNSADAVFTRIGFRTTVREYELIVQWGSGSETTVPLNVRNTKTDVTETYTYPKHIFAYLVKRLSFALKNYVVAF